MPLTEQIDLPGMPPPVVVEKPDAEPKLPMEYDHQAILRKVTCRIDEAAAVLSCSNVRIYEFIESGSLVGVSKAVHLSAAERDHQTVLVESIREHIKKRRTDRECNNQ